MGKKNALKKSDKLIDSLEVRGEYKKPNFLISSKYESSLIENQIQAYSLSHIDHFVLDEKTHTLVDVIKAAELRKLLNGNKGSFYTTLKETANCMTTRNIGFVDPENNTFDFMTVVIRCHYDKGKFIIHYNPYLTDYIQDIKDKYTKLSLKVMMSFTDVIPFRLYEIVKSQCYHVNQVKGKENKYRFRISLPELKLDLGYVKLDKDDTEIINNFIGKKNPDYNLALECAKENKFDAWADFKRYALEPAVKEINNTDSSIHVEFDVVKGGRGGKVIGIIFTVDDYSKGNNVEVEDKEPLTTEEKMAFLLDLDKVFEEPIGIADMMSIAEAANYNLEIIKEKYEMTAGQKIDNLVGWLLSAIKDDYKHVSAIQKAPENCQFEQRKLSLDDIEADLIDN